MWAVGCIFGELLKQKPLLCGKTDIEQLEKMFQLLGAANERIWPGFNALPNVSQLLFPADKYLYNNVEREFPKLSSQGRDLMNALLTYNPQTRITAREALNHPYFRASPFPVDPDVMPTFPTLHTKVHNMCTRGYGYGICVCVCVFFCCWGGHGWVLCIYN